MIDDRLPVVLVVLDGLGDRPVPQLGGRSPSEAASTPVLDALAARGASGWHLPFGWGRAPSSELAHWAMFGYADVPFPGRAVLEALGAGLQVRTGEATVHASLRTSRAEASGVWITGRSERTDRADATALLTEIEPVAEAVGGCLRQLGPPGEATLAFPDFDSAGITDSDPFFERFHPWLRVLPVGVEDAGLAEMMNELLADVRAVLSASSINASRRARGAPPLDVLTTKWAGVRHALPTFVEQTGVAGAVVAGTGLYRGLAEVMGMAKRDVTPTADVAGDLRAALGAAEELMDGGARFVHVHTKATDEAGHTKDSMAKLRVLEAADGGLEGLAVLADRAIVAITGDHATPSTSGVLHTGDPSPLVLCGPTVRRDSVVAFGEEPARSGWLGSIRADELMPLLFGHANRPAFMGHRATARMTVALPDDPEPMPP